MRKFLNKLKSRIPAAVAAATVVCATPLSVFAQTIDKVTIKPNLNAEDVVGRILSFLLTAGQLVGGGVIIYAVISFALSIAQENPDQRSRAIMFVVAGAMLVSIKWVLQSIGVIG